MEHLHETESSGAVEMIIGLGGRRHRGATVEIVGIVVATGTTVDGEVGHGHPPNVAATEAQVHAGTLMMIYRCLVARHETFPMFKSSC